MASESSLTIGVFPRRNAEVTYKIFRPMADYLSAQLGMAVILDVSNDFEVFWRKLAMGKFDLIHCNQYHYLLAHRDFQFEVIGVNSEFGKATIAGTLVVRKDSGIASLQDLRGKKIVFGGGPRAMQSYIVATHLLREAGLDAGDYQEEFAINPLNSVLSVYYNQADAGGAGDFILQLEGIKSRIDTSQLEFLAKGPGLVHLPWAVSTRLKPDLQSQIRTLLLSMDGSQSGNNALQAAELDKIVPVSNQDFIPFRTIIENVKGELY